MAGKKISKSSKKTVLYAVIAVLVIAAVVVAWFKFGYDPLGLFTPDTSAENGTSALQDGSTASQAGTETPSNGSQSAIDENGVYTSKEDVALYLHTYGKLPKNFITKSEAQAAGWSGGGLDSVSSLNGKCIGGDYFGNNEGLLPKKKGREYHECDIDTLHASARGAKRIVWSNDGLIYYTENHYESFTLLYGEP
ncbi:MAG: ribonuclease [Clostridia bacterium]|nr:ribonuclease [Clostridia bacterium]